MGKNFKWYHRGSREVKSKLDRPTLSKIGNTPKKYHAGLQPPEIGIEQDKMLVSVIIYSRPGCHLCGVIHRMACHLQKELSFELQKIDVATDEKLFAAYADRVPVVLIDHTERFSGTLTEGQLRRAIKKARWRSPVSRILSRIKLALTRG